VSKPQYVTANVTVPVTPKTRNFQSVPLTKV
jgi:hypothetical protein